MVTVRRVSTVVTLADTVLPDVIAARGEVVADRGWPTCSVFVTTYPYTTDDPPLPLDEENPIEVVAGAGNNVVRFTGRVRRFRPSSFPKSIEIVATGTLAYAAEWAPAEDIRFLLEFGGGATDQELVQWALDHVPGVAYDAADIGGTGIVLGASAAYAFDWKAGTSAWNYIQSLDRATLYRTYQARDGTIRRVRMIGHPSSVETSFTLNPEDVLDGATSGRDTERTRNAVEVQGHDYGGDFLQVFGTTYQSNGFQGDGSNPATRHPEVFQSNLIEDGNDALGQPRALTGISAQDVAEQVILDVNKEFVEASVPSWRDDAHGPGQTCQLNMLDRLRVGEPMWVARHAWEVGDGGWMVTYGLTGGGLPQSYTPPPV